jgi:hypothetical protein
MSAPVPSKRRRDRPSGLGAGLVGAVLGSALLLNGHRSLDLTVPVTSAPPIPALAGSHALIGQFVETMGRRHR